MAGFITRSVYQKVVEEKKALERDIKILLTTESTEELLEVKHRYLKKYREENELTDLIKQHFRDHPLHVVKHEDDPEELIARRYLPKDPETIRTDRFEVFIGTEEVLREMIGEEYDQAEITSTRRVVFEKSDFVDGKATGWRWLETTGACTLKSCKCTEPTDGEKWCKTCKGLK